MAGQIGWDEGQVLVSDDIAGQTRQALKNTVAILKEAGARPEDVARMTWYITDKAAYMGARQEIGAAFREVMGKHFPAMSLVVVQDLLEDGALVEIETTAVAPENRL